MAQPAELLPHGAPYTVDDLFELPDDGNRYEVLGGSLIVSPAPTPKHQYVADEIRFHLRGVLPAGTSVLTACAVRLPGGDGPIPDLSVTTADLFLHPKGLPADQVHTVIEVVSPGNALVDRAYKREIYAESGIPCYWRVEIEPWRGHTGAYPLIVARVLEAGGWRSVEAAAGVTGALPLAVGRDADGAARTVEVPLDPAVLFVR